MDVMQGSATFFSCVSVFLQVLMQDETFPIITQVHPHVAHLVWIKGMQC